MKHTQENNTAHPWRKKAVFFDLDDTLYWDDRAITETFENVCDHAQQRYGIAAEVVQKAVRQAAFQTYATYETYPFTVQIGINPLEGLWGRFVAGEHPMFRQLEAIAPMYRHAAWHQGLRHVGIDDKPFAIQLAEQFFALRRSIHYVYDDTYAVLDRMYGHVPLLLLTNGSPDLQREKLAGVPKLATYFEHIVISGEFGNGKPAPALFQYALDKMGVDACDVMMVGDKLTTDIQGALHVGMENIWIRRHATSPQTTIVPTHTVSSLQDTLPLLMTSLSEYES